MVAPAPQNPTTIQRTQTDSGSVHGALACAPAGLNTTVSLKRTTRFREFNGEMRERMDCTRKKRTHMPAPTKQATTKLPTKAGMHTTHTRGVRAVRCSAPPKPTGHARQRHNPEMQNCAQKNERETHTMHKIRHPCRRALAAHPPSSGLHP